MGMIRLGRLWEAITGSDMTIKAAALYSVRRYGPGDSALPKRRSI